MALPATDDKFWTYEDYCRLPADGRRYEIIDGRLYVNPAPSTPHQTISRRLQFLFYPFEEAGRLFIYNAPVDLFMPGADPVQPDLVVLTAAQRDLVQYNGIHGAPALVVEVLSPGTAAYDRNQKRRKYAQSGVALYWIVDLAERTLEVFRLQPDGRYVLDASVGPGESYAAPEPFDGVMVDMDRLFANVLALEGD